VLIAKIEAYMLLKSALINTAAKKYHK